MRIEKGNTRYADPENHGVKLSLNRNRGYLVVEEMHADTGHFV